MLALPKVKLPFLDRFTKKTKTAIAVQANDKVLRVLGMDSERRPLFEPVEEIWEHRHPEDREKVLKNVVETLGIKGEEVITCIGVDEGLLKFQRFPANMPKKDLNDALNFYIKSETEQIKEETVYDYYFFPKEEDGKHLKVVLTIARKSAVDRLVNLLQSAGLKPVVVDYEVVTIVNYGLSHNLPPPFAILYADYFDGVLVYYSKAGITYNKLDFNYKYYKSMEDPAILDTFLIEVRNVLVLNEISNIYVAGPIISDEDLLETMMTNLPVLGILDLENFPPAFFIPYTLALSRLEE